METTFQPSRSILRSRITIIEAIELTLLALAVWCLALLANLSEPLLDTVALFALLVALELVVLGSWAIYNLYIRIARAGGQIVDIGLWITASLLTASYTFWAWTVLDINRWIIAKLVYRGEAPVEYAWSTRSKQVRKVWEQIRKDAV